MFWKGWRSSHSWGLLWSTYPTTYVDVQGSRRRRSYRGTRLVCESIPNAFKGYLRIPDPLWWYHIILMILVLLLLSCYWINHQNEAEYIIINYFSSLKISNRFKRKPPRRGQPLYKGSTTGQSTKCLLFGGFTVFYLIAGNFRWSKFSQKSRFLSRRNFRGFNFRI